MSNALTSKEISTMCKALLDSVETLQRYNITTDYSEVYNLSHVLAGRSLTIQVRVNERV